MGVLNIFFTAGISCVSVAVELTCLIQPAGFATLNFNPFGLQSCGCYEMLEVLLFWVCCLDP